MKNYMSICKGLLALEVLLSFAILRPAFTTQSGDFDLSVKGRYRPEMFFGKNISLLNNNNPGNKIWFARHTLDFNLAVTYGKKNFGKEIAEFYFDLRDKGIWGSPGSVAVTNDAETKLLDAVGRAHRHGLSYHIFWMRAGWLRFQLNQILGLPLDNEHWFTIGLFPYQLGRGIALGDAYAVGPEILGFYTESVVDQYAPGGLLHSQIIPGTLSWDLYTGILQNRSVSIRETNEPIYAQEYGRRENPQRGSGKINFLLASRLQWRVFHDEKIGTLDIEPYALYNKDPEQKIEFRGDASSQLGTVGLASTYEHPAFSLGFEWAVNLGQQRVAGWDRNIIKEDNNNGQVTLVNSHVVDQNGKKIPFVRGSEGQKLIECSSQDEAFNSVVIGTVDSGVGFLSGPTTLKNAKNRFRNPYTNEYRGWMFVIDAAYYLLNRDLMLGVETGVASGDDNPNNETVDGTFDGFIGLQEIYSGKKVKSAFLLGGAGKLNRPLSTPDTEQAPTRFSQLTSGFTNIVYCGTGAKWTPSDWPKQFTLNPNLIAYWQEKPTFKFDAFLNKQLDQLASTYLGVEANIFMDYMVLKDLKLFFVGSVFFPGEHYRDIRGKPISAEQQALLDALDRTGFDQTRVPNIGDSPAYTFNLGLEFRF